MASYSSEWPEDFSDLHSHPKFKRYQQEMALKGLSKRTVQDYGRALIIFLEAQNKDPQLLTDYDVKSYLIEFQEMGCSNSKIKIALSAIRHFWELSLKRSWSLHGAIKLTRKQTIPDCLPNHVIMAILNKVQFFKYRIVLYLLYCTGMRLNEGINVRIEDIDKHTMTIRVRKTKGGNERVVPMPKSLHFALGQYWKTHKNPLLIFPMVGRSLQQQTQRGTTTRVMHHTSIQTAMKRAAQVLGITQQASPHILRHSYATHLLEQGLSFRLIQLYLGHKSPNTTARYTHLTQASLANSQEVLAKMTWAIRTDDTVNEGAETEAGK